MNRTNFHINPIFLKLLIDFLYRNAPTIQESIFQLHSLINFVSVFIKNDSFSDKLN